ncbi:MAG: nodulation protein NolW [Cycloclasticus sp.]
MLAELVFYPLNYKAPAEIIPSISPFLKPGENVVAGHSELILRIEASNLKTITTLIDRLDIPTRQLLIYINRNDLSNEQSEGFNLNQQLQVEVDSSAQLTYRGSVKTYSTKGNSVDKDHQTIRVLEGHTAFISRGVDEPNFVIQQNPYHSHGHITYTTEYQRTSKGFYITPSLVGDAVNIEISTWSEEPLQNNQDSTKFSRTSTAIRCSLNEWVNLAGVNKNNSSVHSTRFAQNHHTSQLNNNIWIKVIELQADNNRN